MLSNFFIYFGPNNFFIKISSPLKIMLNTRITNNRQQFREPADDASNKVDLKDEKVVNKILETNNQIRKKIPLVYL